MRYQPGWHDRQVEISALCCLVTEWSKVAVCKTAVEKSPSQVRILQIALNLELCTSGLCGHPAKVLDANSVPKVRILPTPLNNDL